jgi:polyphosphate kinase
MHRNLDRRVEVLVALPSDESVEEVTRLLEVAFADDTAGWELDPDGTWARRSRDEEGPPLRELQEWLIRASKARRRAAPV